MSELYDTTGVTSLILFKKYLEFDGKQYSNEVLIEKPFDEITLFGAYLMSQLYEANIDAFRVFMFFTEHMNNENNIIVSQKAMSENTRIELKSLKEAIKYLETNKFIKLNKNGRNITYHISSNITCFSDERKSRTNAKFLISKQKTKREDYMRNATQTERESVNSYIESISKDTGEHFFDALKEAK